VVQIFIVGHSHTNALQHAFSLWPSLVAHPLRLIHLGIMQDQIGAQPIERSVDDRYQLHPQLYNELQSGNSEQQRLIVSVICGNANYVMGLLQHPAPCDFIFTPKPQIPLDQNAELIPYHMMSEMLFRYAQPHLEMVGALRAAIDEPLFHIEAPPPIGDDRHIVRYLDQYFHERRIDGQGIASRWLRLKMWLLHAEIVRSYCTRIGVSYISPPPDTIDEEGFLLPELYALNATHANEVYGRRVLQQIQMVTDQHT
jgi:hypothetical protein